MAAAADGKDDQDANGYEGETNYSNQPSYTDHVDTEREEHKSEQGVGGWIYLDA